MRTAGQHNIALFGAGKLGQAIAGSTCSPITAKSASFPFRRWIPEMIGKEVGPAHGSRFRRAR